MHTASRGTYGARRVTAELILGRNVAVGHGQVEALMAHASLKGVAGGPKWRRSAPDKGPIDLVNRQFGRDRMNALWVTDITEHHTREGKVYCAAVLDTYSRRIVGWSIDSSVREPINPSGMNPLPATP